MWAVMRSWMPKKHGIFRILDRPIVAAFITIPLDHDLTTVTIKLLAVLAFMLRLPLATDRAFVVAVVVRETQSSVAFTSYVFRCSEHSVSDLGGPGENRTLNLSLKRRVLYQLSYRPILYNTTKTW